MEQPAVAVIQTAFIGDVVLATPLYEAARVSNPDAQIVGVVRKGCENLLETNPHVDTVIVWDKRGVHKGIGGVRHLAGELKRLNIDTALIPHRSFRTAITARIAGIHTRIGFAKGSGSFLHSHRIPYEYGIHEVERNLCLAKTAGWQSDGFRPSIYPDENDRNIINTLLNGIGDYFVLAPGSVWPTKMWPVDYYREIAPLFTDQGLRMVVSGGPADSDICQMVAGAVPGAINTCGKLTLRQSAELYHRSKFLLTGDSAPQHLAAAMDARVFSLFGPTVRSFGFWPYTEHGILIEDNTVSCRPCGAHGHINCKEGTHDCMRRLTPEAVRDIIDEHIR